MVLNKETQWHVNKVADEMGIPRLTATIAYRSFWLFIKTTIEDFPNMSDITEEEFNNLKTNFNIKYLGKLHTNFTKVQNIKRFKEIINERTKNKKGQASS